MYCTHKEIENLHNHNQARYERRIWTVQVHQSVLNCHHSLADRTICIAHQSVWVLQVDTPARHLLVSTPCGEPLLVTLQLATISKHIYISFRIVLSYLFDSNNYTFFFWKKKVGTNLPNINLNHFTWRQSFKLFSNDRRYLNPFPQSATFVTRYYVQVSWAIKTQWMLKGPTFCMSAVFSLNQQIAGGWNNEIK